MKLNIEEQGRYKVVTLQERRLDLFSSAKLKDNLASLLHQQGEKNIILDISNCFYCDASGLSGILFVRQMCEDANGSMVVINIQPNVEKLLKLCKLDSLLMSI